MRGAVHLLKRVHGGHDRAAEGGYVPTNAKLLHAKALPGDPYDEHALDAVITDTKKLTGCAIELGYLDKGYRGHNAENPRRFFINGQKRSVFGGIKREFRQ